MKTICVVMVLIYAEFSIAQSIDFLFKRSNVLKKVDTVDLRSDALSHKIYIKAIIVSPKSTERAWNKDIVRDRLLKASSILKKECSLMVTKIDIFSFDIYNNDFNKNDNTDLFFKYFLDNHIDALTLATFFDLKDKSGQILFYLNGSPRIKSSAFGFSGPESYFTEPKFVKMQNKVWIPADIMSPHFFPGIKDRKYPTVELHELGHNLLDDPEHWIDNREYNIMESASVKYLSDYLEKRRHFTKSQCEKMKSHNTVKFH